jgi:hypothetical protein
VHPIIGRQLAADHQQGLLQEAEMARQARGHLRAGNSSTARPVVAAMYAGVALTVLATTVPYLGRATLADHIRAAYPAYTQARIDTAATTYVAYLSVLGVLGVVGWLWAVRAVTTGKRWARGASTALFVLATSVALTDLLIKDTSGDTGLPALLGWAGIVPCLPGLLAVVLLWRSPRPAGATPPSRPDARAA